MLPFKSGVCPGVSMQFHQTASNGRFCGPARRNFKCLSFITSGSDKHRKFLVINTGRGFPAPKGSRASSSLAKETSRLPAPAQDRSSLTAPDLPPSNTTLHVHSNAGELLDPFRPDRDPCCVRVAAKLLKQIRTSSQTVQQMISLDTASRSMGHVTINR